jgi:histidinol dehydrogenase
MWRPIEVEEWSRRRKGELKDVSQPVSEIIELVRAQGDDALLELTERFDHVRLDSVVVDDERIEAAFDQVEARLIRSLEEAASRIRRFHEMQLENQSWMREVEPGITLGVRLTPLERVGAYVPGGRACYPSTALMCVLPAKVAGVKQVVCCTPAPVNPLTLVAMRIAGADEVYQVGGAQAIAAMALGTSSIRPVQKIVGPGNVFVTQAKMQLRQQVEIDFPAGPSEIAVIADSSGDARFIAADILAQAEHDPNSPCLLITTDESLAKRVGAELESQALGSTRKEIIQRAMGNSGYVLVKDVQEAVMISNRVAPEHLSIQTEDPDSTLLAINNAGSIFLGPFSPVACGDYASGTNHVLPTAGYARLYSGLDVRHFCKACSVQMLTKEGLQRIGELVTSMARAEGLEAHAASIEVRLRR